jgi:hypothetical protein
MRPIEPDRIRFLNFEMRKQRKHSTRSTWRGISERRHCWIGSGGLPAARISAKVIFAGRVGTDMAHDCADLINREAATA